MPKKQKEEAPAADALTAVAKAVGKAAGTVAKLAGAGEAPVESDAPKAAKVPKLAPKNKSRLPRREKKARQKSAAK